MHSSGLCAACRRTQEDPDDRPQKCAAILVWLGEHGFKRTEATRYNRLRFVRGNVVVTVNEATVFVARCEDGRYTNTFQRDIMDVTLKQIERKVKGLCS